MLLALLLAGPYFLPDDVPQPKGCTCLGVELHEYDRAELVAKGPRNVVELGKRTTCHMDCQPDMAAWAALLAEKGWDVFQKGRDFLNAQKEDRFLKVAGKGVTHLQRGDMRAFTLQEGEWLQPIAGCNVYERKTLDNSLDVTNSKTGNTMLRPPIERQRVQHPDSLSAVEIDALYLKALRSTGWDSLTDVRGGGVGIFHYAKKGRDLWLKLTPAGNDYTLELKDVGAQEEQAKLARELAEKGHVALYGIYFDTGSPELRPDSETALQSIRALLSADAKLRLEVQGHTDNTGKSPGNQLLSEARAQKVTAWLTAHGIEAARLTARGYADSKPVASNATPEGRALNRRVELATASP